MEPSTAQRRLVKSPPELWAEVSSEDLLGRHMAPFGEIRITRADPETTVAWEGDRASGTVELEPAGWGTNVILTATPTPPPAPTRADPPPQADPAVPPAQKEPRRGFFARLFRRPAPPPRAPSQPAPGPEPKPPDPDPAPTLHAEAILADVLDDLGAAHHRPFSRD